MLSRCKPTGVRRRVRKVLCTILAAVILITVYFEVAVRVQLAEVIRTGMRTAAQQAVSEAVGDFLSENPDAGERLAHLQFTDGGTVSSLTTDSAYINYVKTQIIRRAQRYIDERTHAEGVSVPLGSFSGLVFLNNLGPSVALSVDSRQTVSCSFVSTFESAGINQTLHHIALIVDVDVAVYHPFRILDGIVISSDFEIAQTVIVGSVPTYGGVVTY